jgi:hypothetical protein
MRLFPWLAVLVSLALVSGCQRNSSSLDYFPLSPGHRWTYMETTEHDSGSREQRQVTFETLDQTDLPDGSAFHRRSDDGMHYWLRSDQTGVFRVASRFELEEFFTPDKPQRYVLMQPLKLGTNWPATTVPYLLQRQQEFPREIRHTHRSVPMVYRIDALDEKVKTEAGLFEHCIRVVGEGALKLYVDPIAGWKELPLLTREWYCPGVGLVKLTRDEHAQSTFLTGGTLTLELQDWR